MQHASHDDIWRYHFCRIGTNPDFISTLCITSANNQDHSTRQYAEYCIMGPYETLQQTQDGWEFTIPSPYGVWGLK